MPLRSSLEAAESTSYKAAAGMLSINTIIGELTVYLDSCHTNSVGRKLLRALISKQTTFSLFHMVVAQAGTKASGF
jgi:hypothetical protein